jgi:hypothetical protein
METSQPPLFGKVGGIKDRQLRLLRGPTYSTPHIHFRGQVKGGDLALPGITILKKEYHHVEIRSLL